MGKGLELDKVRKIGNLTLTIEGVTINISDEWKMMRYDESSWLVTSQLTTIAFKKKLDPAVLLWFITSLILKAKSQGVDNPFVEFEKEAFDEFVKNWWKDFEED